MGKNAAIADHLAELFDDEAWARREQGINQADARSGFPDRQKERERPQAQGIDWIRQAKPPGGRGARPVGKRNSGCLLRRHVVARLGLAYANRHIGEDTRQSQAHRYLMTGQLPASLTIGVRRSHGVTRARLRAPASSTRNIGVHRFHWFSTAPARPRNTWPQRCHCNSKRGGHLGQCPSHAWSLLPRERAAGLEWPADHTADLVF